ncbi:DNA primase [Neisseria meningitidis]|uniref:DNA primase n=1 Tax=Neisseria meningitidis serogroup A / serotype 4A (strain DSM 15465 / Z2491) TaxID=122587 RepID=DNAG_NEIMA|nr:DNA primase [Neisseria meningitidis]P57028.1 RecName: Full=DNA primase [Neisseria meningitidis Z2491]ARC06451.1 DNA primase [Neisseria meningitidis]ELK70917.1 DNA primase [Neisseria meningitidis 63041]ELL01939.1 DNA primase [Neisseria meningitidis 63049]ELL11489.1 DNA primase [Neisseria meningitidis 65014]EOB66047.1 DNA primase [Neisseria meningitidis 65012]
MIPSDFIDELLAKTDIVDIIDEQVPLKKGGANYMACCPFHKEKTPSFSVSPTKQFYHCFSCGAHGSAIGFVMEHQGLSFPEAVQFLADRVGMVVPKVHGQNDNPEVRAERKKKQQTLEETTAAAADFYAQQLKFNPAAKAYLDKRGLSAEVIAHYGLGYAPDGWQPLTQVFQPYPNTALVDTGMVIDNEGRHYDRFRHRIMFPIRNPRGQVIGFGGRVLDDSKPKYLNSPDTPLFDKGKNLYGLYEGRAAVKEAGRILVVEGYMDVVALAQFGVGYGVAALGTATTAEHVKILMRQADSIYFCFDGDSAGRKAAWRALENALPQLKDDKSLHFLFLPEEHDPDSYIRAYGKAQFEDALLNQSKPLSEYFWEHLSDGIHLNTQEGKAELVKTSSPLLAQITAPALAYLLKQRLSELVGIDPDNLAQLLGQEAPKRHVKQKNYKLPPISVKQPVMPTLVQRQIRSLLINPDWAAYIDLPDYLALDGDFACLANLAETIKNHPSVPATAQVLEHMRGSPYEETINRIFRSALQSEEMEGGGEEDCENFQIGIKKLLNELKYSQIEALKQKSLQSGLNESEKKLLLSLLTAKQN